MKNKAIISLSLCLLLFTGTQILAMKQDDNKKEYAWWEYIPGASTIVSVAQTIGNGTAGLSNPSDLSNSTDTSRNMGQVSYVAVKNVKHFITGGWEWDLSEIEGALYKRPEPKPITPNLWDKLRILGFKVPGIKYLGSDQYYIYFNNQKAKNQEALLRENDEIKDSNFFNKMIHEWAPNSPKEMLRTAQFAFMDLKKEYNQKYDVRNPGYAFKKQGAFLKDGRACSKLNTAELKKLRQEVIEGMAHLYKIHLQVKEKYLVEFFEAFLKFVTTDPQGKLIRTVKATQKFTPGLFVKNKENEIVDNPPPVIVAYLPFIPGNKNEKNKVLKDVIGAILKFAKNYKIDSKELDLGICPRMNYQVKDFVYLAQGNGNTKLIYQKAIREDKTLPGNILYNQTYNWGCIAGYEFDFVEEMLFELGLQNDPKETESEEEGEEEFNIIGDSEKN